MSTPNAVHATGLNDQKIRVTVYRRPQSSAAEGLCGALRVNATGLLARAILFRIAINLEEALEGLSNAPICIQTRGDESVLWIPGETTEADLEVELHLLTLVAIKDGFALGNGQSGQLSAPMVKRSEEAKNGN